MMSGLIQKCAGQIIVVWASMLFMKHYFVCTFDAWEAFGALRMSLTDFKTFHKSILCDSVMLGCLVIFLNKHALGLKFCACHVLWFLCSCAVIN